MHEQRSIPVHLEDTSIPSLLEAALRPLVEQAERQQSKVRLAAAGPIPPLRVDREKIAWAIATLVGNALRYRAGDAMLSIVVTVAYDAASEIVAISVDDDGPGIPDGKLPFLFERRQRAVVVDGLALSLVRQIVGAHGGQIEVVSRREHDDHGTTITIGLPFRG